MPKPTMSSEKPGEKEFLSNEARTMKGAESGMKAAYSQMIALKNSMRK